MYKSETLDILKLKKYYKIIFSRWRTGMGVGNKGCPCPGFGIIDESFLERKGEKSASASAAECIRERTHLYIYIQREEAVK